MVEHRNVRMDLMSTKEVAEYLKTHDLVILPVGCFEMHGPIVPLACDALNAWAASILMAEKFGCLVMPPVYYTFPGATGPWPGSVDISPEITQGYVRAIALALLKGGFGRVILCGFHAPLRFVLQAVIRSIYQETGQIVMDLSPRLMPRDLAAEELDYKGGEDIMVLASLKILGLHGACDPATKVDKLGEHPFKTMDQMGALGATVPWTFSRDHQHTGIRSCLRLEDADKAVRVMKKAIDRLGDLPDLFAKYQQQMRRLVEEAPWGPDATWSI